MGLIMLPLLAAWLAGAGYAVFLWYSLWTGGKPLLYVVALLIVGVLLALLYARVGLSGFKAREEVWAFEIPMHFLVNKTAIAMFVLVVAFSFLMRHMAGVSHATADCFVVAFALSFGTVAASLYADSFVRYHDIRVTY
ncbi:hypothetical protein FIU83_09175 [Halomonas sp. THAF5a]|uniref:hypothetical protein n=1 Tax=Halomonas sp. THAF5a TaxID=2587844 RepID=UPI001267DB2E|nr:hypothetical protein [Halomonas sp. THAF5a]QFU01810.1 hypothetical protein FIU83_09175 [Halomonas sp. THAF5a]